MNDVATAPATEASGWEAKLALSFVRRDARTVLGRRAHRGPLVVQKPLYAEGEAVCQCIIVHPPGGIAGGDRLGLEVHVGDNACAQLVTPGAAKWYRSSNAPARQRLDFSVARHALLEWLPHESIIFDGAMPCFESSIDLFDDAVFIGWDIVCLGRRHSAEQWARGNLRQSLVLRRDGTTLWTERARFGADSRLVESPLGLDRRTVYGTFLASATRITDDLVIRCRALKCSDGEVALTRLPGVLLGRYRGDSGQAAREFFGDLWSCVRPALAARDAVPPRIWAT